MSGIFGALGLSDTERVRIATLGQAVVFDAINQVLDAHNADVAAAMSVFVEKTVTDYTERYLLAGSGKLQQLADQAPSAAVKRSGYWDVAYPLRGWGAAIGGSRVSLAYMTVQELDAHLKTIMIEDLNTVRWRILTALFEDTNLTFVDKLHGSITIRRLANTDGTLYPPVLGSETDADDQHYTGVEYAPASIDSTHDPVPNAVAELVEHFGGQDTFGDPIVFFHNSDATSYLAALTGFAKVEDRWVQSANGSTADLATGLPNGVPGRIHGRYKNAWLSEWAWIPAGYGLAVHLGAPRPLVMRVDPADTGLGRGLQLVATDVSYPLQAAYYEHRFGFGCGNRLNGYAVYMNASNGGVYAPPAAYSE